MKAVVYSLFGDQDKRAENCFDFKSYLRGLLINIRMNRLLFPDWQIILETDKFVFAKYGDLFKRLPIKTNVNEPEPLTKAMLWRLKPVFEIDERQKAVYSHVLCRDLDSPPTYRDAQAVQYWINRDKAAHAITDSVSHTLPMMGGMIGFIPKYFTMRTGFTTWDAMFKNCPIDFNKKGADQTFLNRYIYPVFAKKGEESITQHYFNGHGDTFLEDFRTCKCSPIQGHDSHCANNMDLAIPFAYKESNEVCGHIGASGFYEGSMFRFLRKYWNDFDDLLEVERDYSNIFYWVNE